MKVVGSHGMTYLPTFTIKFKPNIGKYSIDGAFGNGGLRLTVWC